MQQTSRDAYNLVNRGVERGFVGLRRFVEAGDLSHELERGRSDLVLSDRRIEVEKNFDIAAHALRPPCRNSANSSIFSHGQRRAFATLFSGGGRKYLLLYRCTMVH